MTDDDYSTTSVAADHLKQFLERVERLEEEKREVAEQIKEVYAEAKGNGFDTKTLRKIVAIRKKDPSERSEEEAMIDLYLSALGMLPADDGDSPAPRPSKASPRITPRSPIPKTKKRKPAAGFARVDESEW